MKKLSLYIFLGLLFCKNSYAEILKYNYNFDHKPEINSKGYGICEKLKWDIK